MAMASGRPLPICKPIVGNNMFIHESGIHADGVIKNPPHTYEIFSPEEVGGLERQIVLGKHSGSNAIIMKFKEYGINLSNEEANNILPILRSTTINLKRPPFDKEIMYIYEEYLREKAGKESKESGD